MPSALQKPLAPSAELAAVIGPGPHTRAEATSKLWDYIKQNGCQNPETDAKSSPTANYSQCSGAPPRRPCSRCPSISTGISPERDDELDCDGPEEWRLNPGTP